MNTWRSKKTLISIALIISAVIYIALALKDSSGLLLTSVAIFNPLYAGLSVFPATILVYTTAYIYFLILARITPEVPLFRHVGSHFIISQVIRHIPGKIWGILYQTQAVEKWVQARYIVLANIEHYILLNTNSIAFAISLFIFYKWGIMYAFGIYFAFIILFFIALKKSLFQQLVSLLRHENGRRSPVDTGRNRNEGLIISLLQLDSFFYILTCFFILSPHFGISDAILIGMCYAIAWLAGALATVMPGGVFVREASFVWLSGLFGFNPAAMFAFSIVARILFTIADIVSATLAFALIYVRNRHEE